MEETVLEIVIGILARAGILAAHGFEYIGGYHTVVAVAILWSLEEIVAIKVSSRVLKHQKLKAQGRVGGLESRIFHSIKSKKHGTYLDRLKNPGV